jgi:hypothetical protein
MADHADKTCHSLGGVCKPASPAGQLNNLLERWDKHQENIEDNQDPDNRKIKFRCRMLGKTCKEAFEDDSYLRWFCIHCDPPQGNQHGFHLYVRTRLAQLEEKGVLVEGGDTAVNAEVQQPQASPSDSDRDTARQSAGADGSDTSKMEAAKDTPLKERWERLMHRRRTLAAAQDPDNQKIEFGSKMLGKTYKEAFENHGYLKWFCTHCDPPKEKQHGFHSYAMTKLMQLEED